MPIDPRSLVICIPSKARADLFKKYTYQIVRHTKVPWFVFVEPQDYESYSTFVPSKNLVTIGFNDRGMSYVLDKMRQFCLLMGYKFCFKMDDDVFHWYNKPSVSPKTEQAKMIEDLRELIVKADKKTGKELIGGICFPYKRFHTDWRPFTHANVMLQTLYVIRTDCWTVLTDTNSSHEEYFASAGILDKGLITLKCGMLCWGADLSCLPGGFQSFEDRVERQYKDYDILEQKYPHLAKYTKRRVYTQKTGVDFLVTDKTHFNKLNSVRLPITGKSKGKLSKETETWLEKLM